MLKAVVDGGWIITGSWPIDTEMEARIAAARPSATCIICPSRLSSAQASTDGSDDQSEIGDWRDVLQELPKRIHEWMPRLADEGVVGADAIFACLGPALEIFSRYSRVEKANGERSLCANIWSTFGLQSPKKLWPWSSRAPMPQALNLMLG